MVKQSPKGSDNGGLHVAIEGHSELRMAILDPAKESVGFLKMEEKINELKAEKLEALDELKTVLADMAKLNEKLGRLLPKRNLGIPKKEFDTEVHQIEEDSRMIGAPTPKPEEPPKLDKLEEELADIESRINNLR